MAVEVFAAQEVVKKENSLPLSQVLRHTYLNNPEIRAARAELRGVHEALPQALANWKPSINATAELSDTNIDGSQTLEDSTAKTAGASFSQPLFRGGRTVSETSAAEYTIRAQLQALLSVEQAVLLRAATAYMDVVRDQSLFALSEGNLELRETEHEATQNRFEVGELTKTDVSQSRSRLSGAEADVTTAKGNLRSSRAVFLQVTGLQPDNIFYPKKMPYELPGDLAAALEVALEQNPDLLSREAAYKAAEDDVDSVWGELLPAVSLDGSWSQNFDDGDDDSTTRKVGLSASMPLYAGGGTRSRVRAAKQTANQRYLQILETRRLVEQETVTAWENLATAKAEIESRKAQVEAAKVAREGVSAEAEFGERTVLDVLDADQEYLDAQVSLVSSERNAIVAVFSLMEEMGDLRPAVLGFADDAIDHDAHLSDVTSRLFSMDVMEEK